eukprot:20262-Heterococcus_DN1.PRE.1
MQRRQSQFIHCSYSAPLAAIHAHCYQQLHTTCTVLVCAVDYATTMLFKHNTTAERVDYTYERRSPCLYLNDLFTFDHISGITQTQLHGRLLNIKLSTTHAVKSCSQGSYTVLGFTTHTAQQQPRQTR